MLKLFLDDIREKPNNSWILVKDYLEFVTFIEKSFRDFLPISVISFDHDLALKHYTITDNELLNMDYDSIEEFTGLHCARFLIKFYKDNNIDFPQIFVHSMNPGGSKNIINEFKDIGVHAEKIFATQLR